MAYKRIMLKLSGEALSKPGSGNGLHQPTLHEVAKLIHEIDDGKVQIAIVVGGGNIWRYRDTKGTGIERTASDAMGMLATIMNGVALQAALESFGSTTRVLSAIDVPQLAEPYLRLRAVRHMEKGRIVICAGGTGNPYCTTDSAAALRGLELNCDIMLKATNVDGIYDKDPRTNTDAKLFKDLTFDEAIERHLEVMDQAAFSLCREYKLPIRVFNFSEKDAFKNAVAGKDVGTLVHA